LCESISFAHGLCYVGVLLSDVVGRGRSHGEREVQEQDRDFAGDAGLVDPADAGVGAAARVCTEQGDTDEFGGDLAGRYGIVVSGAASAGACGMDCGGVEGVGGRTAAEGVSTDGERETAVEARGFAVGTDYGGGCRCVASSEQGG